MTPHEAASELCRRLTNDVCAIAPKGIGFLPEVWAAVGPADAEFMAALVRWEQTPSEPNRLALKGSYEAVLAAWRSAVVAYEGTIQPSEQA